MGILPKESGIVGRIMHKFAFPVHVGVLSLLGAAFLPNEAFVGGADFLSNSNAIDYALPRWHIASRLSSWTSLRDYLGDIFAAFLLVFQRRFCGCFIQQTSPESYDVQLQDAL